MRTFLSAVVVLIWCAACAGCTPLAFGLGVYQLATFAIEHGDPKKIHSTATYTNQSVMDVNRSLIKPQGGNNGTLQ
jgi:hypothetical protein